MASQPDIETKWSHFALNPLRSRWNPLLIKTASDYLAFSRRFCLFFVFASIWNAAFLCLSGYWLVAIILLSLSFPALWALYRFERAGLCRDGIVALVFPMATLLIVGIPFNLVVLVGVYSDFGNNARWPVLLMSEVSGCAFFAYCTYSLIRKGNDLLASKVTAH